MSNKSNNTTNNNNSGQQSKEKEGGSAQAPPEVVDLEKIISALTSTYMKSYSRSRLESNSIQSDLQFQNRRAAKYQYASYRAQIQHHDNLKKIVIGFNKLTDVVLERLGASVPKITLNENESLLVKEHSFAASDDVDLDIGDFGSFSASHSMMTGHPTSSSSHGSTFHDVLMGYKDEPHSPFLRQAILSITEDKFRQLRESSFEILLPIAIQLLKEHDHRNLAMLFIAQGTATESLEAVFRYPRNRQLVFGCIKVIDSVPENAYEPELLEDLRRLRQYLMSALADPITSPKLF